MEVIGLIGSICFAICGIPAAYEAWRDKTCAYSINFLMLWFIGEVLTLVYTISIGEWILVLNYVCNLICLVVIIYYNNKDTQ